MVSIHFSELKGTFVTTRRRPNFQAWCGSGGRQPCEQRKNTPQLLKIKLNVTCFQLNLITLSYSLDGINSHHHVFGWLPPFGLEKEYVSTDSVNFSSTLCGKCAFGLVVLLIMQNNLGCIMICRRRLLPGALPSRLPYEGVPRAGRQSTERSLVQLRTGPISYEAEMKRICCAFQ